jgi:hypothetical protein
MKEGAVMVGRANSLAELTRLDAIAQHLGLGKKWIGSEMVSAVTTACLNEVRPILADSQANGDSVSERLADHYRVKFEPVYSVADIADLERRYVQEKRELGFVQVREELSDPAVDALLFLRTKADHAARDRWVAVLNLQFSAYREYWNKFHEITHRIIEPPQGILLFRRHDLEFKDSVESLVDHVAGNLAFYPEVFRPLVLKFASESALSFDVIRAIRSRYAPQASLLAATNAVVKYWPRPAIAFKATMSGRVRQPMKDRALRVQWQGRNTDALPEGLCPHKNMRVPESSPIYDSYSRKENQDGFENLQHWTTSTGGGLRNKVVFTSANWAEESVYCVMSIPN